MEMLVTSGLPFSFVCSAFIVVFFVLLRSLKEERGENRQIIKELKKGQDNLDKKLDKILNEVAFKEVMERE